MPKSKAVPFSFQNGWLDELDGRTGIAQVMRLRFDALTYDLGGTDALSYQQRSLVERALWLEYWLADQERLLATGFELDIGKWVQATNSLQGLYSKLGLAKAKHTKDITEYLSSKAKS
ncbi:hypothetical protein [Brumicola blandensis]|uniref:Uncharacterized protein n=1 Tax=Brumicola blandensis TaxID=3075611 RepID=A0AAW8QZQ8_9ALTE|nr:hypothetical protein [Alteromonas sp. W409]MDT0581437.1 hypothetical protein [Alteromonas sp. W409]